MAVGSKAGLKSRWLTFIRECVARIVIIHDNARKLGLST